MERKEFKATLTFSYYWTSQRLVIEADSLAARNYITRILEDETIIVRLKSGK